MGVLVLTTSAYWDRSVTSRPAEAEERYYRQLAAQAVELVFTFNQTASAIPGSIQGAER